ncbi:uncharacterized protein C2845_PM07G15230 [Panicum miliaceum]|uniref:Uncharacterized protein n=1 Tax=Panicum miliaceum TaxID=4540 RepID=A0A3L6SQR9_PANMI|nr:uncharacterized protein C2845_PM07G15230 [Panicum miliaceum]
MKDGGRRTPRPSGRAQRRPALSRSHSLELWDIRGNKSITLNNAHDSLVAALAASSGTGHVASVSLHKIVKLWK